MLGALAALALLPALHLPQVQNPFHAFRTPTRGEAQTVLTPLGGGWRLAQVDDSFTGQNACRLDGPRGVRLAQGVATFSFGGRIDTANAIFRIDDGAVHNVGEVGPEVAGHGVRLISGNAWNPSDGRVRIPWTRLSGARKVDIRPNVNRAHRDYPLDGLNAAIGAARARGCPDFAST